MGAMDGGEDTEERDPREEMDVFAAEAVSERIVDLLRRPDGRNDWQEPERRDDPRHRLLFQQGGADPHV